VTDRAYRRAILAGEALAIGATVLIREDRRRVAGALPTDHEVIRQLQRDWPDGVPVALMHAMIVSFRDVADRYGVWGLRHAALVMARARLAA